MSGFSIDITGDLNQSFDDMTDQVKQIVNDELEAFGIETVTMAKQLCPVNEGFLRNSITFDKQPLSVILIVAAGYGAYVEFGTGVFAESYVPSLPPEVQEFAITFFVNGKGHVPARPFLFPAIESNRVKLIDNLKRQLHA